MEPHVKGHGIKSVYNYVLTNYSPDERNKIIARVDPEMVALYPKLQKSDWYPIRHLVSVYDAVAQEKGPDEMRPLGYGVAQEATGTFLKLVMKILTPAMFANKFDSFFHQYFDFGEIRADLTDISSNCVRFCIDLKGVEFPHHHVVSLGWIESAFHGMGKKNVAVTLKSEHGQRVVTPEWLYEVRW